MSKDSLYNKHRPKSFLDVVGQDHITKILESHIKEENLPHCIIMYGPPGTGKTSCARIVANMLNSSNHGVIEKDCSSEGGKDSLKTIQIDAYNKPMLGEWKTYIFDEAQEIGKKAFGSLLKVTEEPPEKVIFIFVTTEFNKIPGTIKSRSKSLSFNRIQNRIIREKVEEILKIEGRELPESLIDLAVHSGGGSLRNTLVNLETVLIQYPGEVDESKIAESLGVIGIKRLTEFSCAYLYKDFKKLHDMVSMFYEEYTDTTKAMSDLQQFIMDCRLAITLPTIKDSVKSNIDYFFELTQVDQKDVSYRKSLGSKLDFMYDLTLDLESDLRRSTNKEAVLTRFLIKLAKSW